MTNPFNFLTDFDRWFYYEKCIHFEKLDPKIAETDTRACCGGWERCHPVENGRHSGGWRMKIGAHKEILDIG